LKMSLLPLEKLANNTAVGGVATGPVYVTPHLSSKPDGALYVPGENEIVSPGEAEEITR
jgi:hypothetical protein